MGARKPWDLGLILRHKLRPRETPEAHQEPQAWGHLCVWSEGPEQDRPPAPPMARLPSPRVRRGEATHCEKATWLDDKWASPSAAQSPFGRQSQRLERSPRGPGHGAGRGRGTRDTCTAETAASSPSVCSDPASTC